MSHAHEGAPLTEAGNALVLACHYTDVAQAKGNQRQRRARTPQRTSVMEITVSKSHCA